MSFKHSKTIIPFPGKKDIPCIVTTHASSNKSDEVGKLGIVLAHGASGDMNNARLQRYAEELANFGHTCVRFTASTINLAHRINCCRQVISHLFHKKKGTHPVDAMILGGHSMGARVAASLASQLSESSEAEIPKVLGVMCFSFPLRNPSSKNSQSQREEILIDIPSAIPVLFVSGTKDGMCDLKLLKSVREKMNAESELIKIVGGDHGLNVGKVAGRNDALLEAVSEKVGQWCDEVSEEGERRLEDWEFEGKQDNEKNWRVEKTKIS
ncbi:uncharacterized protein VTP21DRAFT_6726 [Calcarisporiella thermophila]|uniref:uncharacterized protein n=1 Tax=Calcarisporiella thermophila TaxID=911321 RepID=UPI003743BF70